MPKCDHCPDRAIKGVTDSIEIPSSDPNGWRQFKESEPRLGCAKHPPTVAVTRYLDGRVVPFSQCVPEKVVREEAVYEVESIDDTGVIRKIKVIEPR